MRSASSCFRVARRSTSLAAAGFALVVASPASAQPPDPALMERLTHHLDAIKEIGKRASLHLDLRTEELDGDGKVSSTETQTSRVEPGGDHPHETIEHATKDGKDTTAEAREKAKKDEEEAAKKKGKDDDPKLTLPFEASSASVYSYDQVSTDAADPTRVEIAFSPRKPDKHTVEGKAWVDTTTGTILSAGVKMSKPPTFVDWVHFTVELGEKTALGPALSRMTFEVKGGILFFKKHLRGEIRMSDYHLAP
jgi:hypothetical protein